MSWKRVNAKSGEVFSGSPMSFLLVFLCPDGTLCVGYPGGTLRKGRLARRQRSEEDG